MDISGKINNKQGIIFIHFEYLFALNCFCASHMLGNTGDSSGINIGLYNLSSFSSGRGKG